MAKYILVASYYNSYKKTYEDEINVEIEGVDLSSLQKIDIFTSSNTKEQILDMFGIKGLNHLAIKFFKNKNANPEHYRVILNDSNYKETIENIENIEYYLPNGKVYAKGIKNKDTILYKKEREFLGQLIKDKDLSKFNEIYTKDDAFKFLVNRYLTTKYTDATNENQDYNLIFKEFSNYTTFRKWIIARQKHKERQLNNTIQLNNNKKFNNLQRKVKEKPKKIELKSIEELEDEYITMLAKKVQEEFKKAALKDDKKSIKEISEKEARRKIIEQVIQDFNNQIDENEAYEKEEFLDDEEISEMTNGVDDSYEKNYYDDRFKKR